MTKCFYRQQSMCEFCDSSDPDLSHPITNAIDGSHSFWQSPSLAVDNENEFVTIDIDLGQVRIFKNSFLSMRYYLVREHLVSYCIHMMYFVNSTVEFIKFEEGNC